MSAVWIQILSGVGGIGAGCLLVLGANWFINRRDRNQF
jgi:uncharacterized membrane protein YhiD involved in acid resistance